MTLTIAEYAESEGISQQRARELARAGKIAARRTGRAWEIDTEASPPRFTHRPLSAQSLNDLLTVIADMNLDSVTGVRKQRAADRLRGLRALEHPAALLAQWAGRTPERPARAHQRAILRAAQLGRDDYLKLVLAEVDSDDLTDPKLLKKRLRDAMQVNQLRADTLAERAGATTEDVKQLLSRGRLKNYGRTARILRTAGLRPGAVPR